MRISRRDPSAGPNRQPAAAADAASSRAVAWWHALLCSLAVLNVTLWSFSAIASHGQSPQADGADSARQLMLLLSAGYVFGCAYRCVLPVYDIPRIVIVDSWLSSVVVGRSVATLAELCFAAQCALILHRVALLNHSEFGQAASLAIVPCIALAEVFSWQAVLTTAQRGHAAENALWGLSATLLVISLLVIGPHRLAAMYPPMLAWCVAGVLYAAFIFLFDVPMYLARWAQDQRAGRRYLSVAQGLTDVCRRRVVSRRWEDWKSEVLWMTLYFSCGVWSSISMVYASVTLYAQL
jgi:hypothetical protein